MTTTTVDVHRRLTEPDLPVRLHELGFPADDAADLQQAVVRVLARPDDLETITTLAGRLLSHLGEFTPYGHPAVWSDVPLDADGVLPMIALVVTAPEVAAWHAGRGVPAEISAATLTDLAQQVRVHRQTFGTFGLHTHDWLTIAWSGALYGLGRLQFNLQPGAGGWVLSTHIPQSGPLTPGRVDESFTSARRFFATHFPDHPVCDIICQSWLLDPALTTILPGTNLAAFQRRWQPTGERYPGEPDVLFFVFNRRGPVDPEDLPADTTLRRAVRDRLISGQGWSTIVGRLAP